MTRRALIAAGLTLGFATALAASPSTATLAIVAIVAPLLVTLGFLGLEDELARARARRRSDRRRGYVYPR